MARGRARRQHGGSIRALTSGRWQVRVLDRATGKHVSLGTFPTKQDANAALNRAVADQSRGRWVSPERGRVTVATYARGWIEGHPGLGPRTRERYAGLLQHHIAPHLGQARLGDLTTATVRRWHAALHETASPDTAAMDDVHETVSRVADRKPSYFDIAIRVAVETTQYAWALEEDVDVVRDHLAKAAEWVSEALDRGRSLDGMLGMFWLVVSLLAGDRALVERVAVQMPDDVYTAKELSSVSQNYLLALIRLVRGDLDRSVEAAPAQ